MIEIRKIVKRYDHSSINILDEITCSFPDKGFFVIVGETGCGKKHVFEIISRYDKC